jgi:carbon-monoxide dehydrogenase large subunit
MVHAAILRSPHGHARIRGIDTSRAKRAPGVVAVFTGADTEAGLKCIPCAWLLPNAGLNIAPYRAIATDVVRYVGDAVAVVVAESDYQAYDALDLIEVDYEPLPAVVDPQKAAAAGAPQLHEEAPGNVAFHWMVEGGLQLRRRRGARSHHSAAADPDGDGAARRCRAVHASDR